MLRFCFASLFADSSFNRKTGTAAGCSAPDRAGHEGLPDGFPEMKMEQSVLDPHCGGVCDKDGVHMSHLEKGRS